MKHLSLLIAFCLSFSLFQLFAQAMPAGLPTMQTDWYRNEAICDYIFVNTTRFQLPAQLASGGIIFNKRMEVVWYTRSQDNLFDFEPNANGKLTFNINNYWYVVDSNLLITPHPTCVGSFGDLHELLLLDDGRSFEICQEDTFMDLRSIQTRSGQPGDSMGQVNYSVILELDSNRNVLQKWRGIDHFGIQDVDPYFFTIPTFLELNHTNSFA